MKGEELKAKLDEVHARIPAELIRSIAVSMASFIAEIDASSSDVADYIERRLAPLAPFVNTSDGVRRALELIKNDARRGTASTAAPRAAKEER